jgi:hypothetical protein
LGKERERERASKERERVYHLEEIRRGKGAMGVYERFTNGRCVGVPGC